MVYSQHTKFLISLQGINLKHSIHILEYVFIKCCKHELRGPPKKVEFAEAGVLYPESSIFERFSVELV
jgi:hypothetical protein